MPNALVQLEQAFEPVIERLYRLASPCIQVLAFSALEELMTRQATAMTFVAWCRWWVRLVPLSATAILGADKTAISATVVRVVCNAFAHVVAVIAAVGQDDGGLLRQLVDLLGERDNLLRALLLLRMKQPSGVERWPL